MLPSSEKWYHKWSWFDVDATKAEKKLLLKQDFMILTFGCLTFFTKVTFLLLDAIANRADRSSSSLTFKHSKMPTLPG